LNTDHFRFPCFLGRRVHLGVTGSIAAYKSLELLRLLVDAHIDVGVTVTASGQRFVGAASFQALGAGVVHTSMFPDERRGLGEDPFAHLTPGRSADAFVIAPATANIIAKIAGGIADDMLSTQALAFRGPLIVAPAMNPNMWSAPATQSNWRTLLDRGVIAAGPDNGSVACGDTGQGRLCRLEHIFAQVLRALSPKDLAGKNVLITLGPTREPWDAVRYLSNPSSGLMGATLAMAAWMRGADVHVVAGPTDFDFPPSVHVVRVTTALEMLAAASDLFPAADIACCTAAVADFRPVPPTGGVAHKLKKRDIDPLALSIALTPNPDILRTLGAAKRKGQILIGFAAETDGVLAQAKMKLAEKRLDLIVANRIGVPGSGFAASTNVVAVLDRTGRVEQWPELPKTEVAWRIWDLLQHL